MSLIVLSGAVRSGKSAAAERLALSRGAAVVAAVAGWDGDGEMARRIEAHRDSRPEGWETRLVTAAPGWIAEIDGRCGAPARLPRHADRLDRVRGGRGGRGRLAQRGGGGAVAHGRARRGAARAPGRHDRRQQRGRLGRRALFSRRPALPGPARACEPRADSPRGRVRVGRRWLGLSPLAPVAPTDEDRAVHWGKVSGTACAGHQSL